MWRISFPISLFLLYSSTLLILGLIWLSEDSPEYPGTNTQIATISAVGGTHSAVFISLFALTAAALVATSVVFVLFAYDRGMQIEVLLGVACGLAVIAAVAMVLLTAFDRFNYYDAHILYSFVFFVSVLVLTTLNFFGLVYLWESYDHEAVQNQELQRQSFFRKISHYSKIVIGAVSILIFIAYIAIFPICGASNTSDSCNSINTASAVLEWALSILLAAFFSTWIIDYYSLIRVQAAWNPRREENHAGGALEA